MKLYENAIGFVDIYQNNKHYKAPVKNSINLPTGGFSFGKQKHQVIGLPEKYDLVSCPCADNVDIVCWYKLHGAMVPHH